MKIAIGHPTTKANPITSLAADIAAAASSLTVKNTEGFSNEKLVVIGRLGFEQTEIVRPSTITPPDTIALTGTTKFPHNADSKVLLFDYNQIKIYRSTTGINGTYTLIDTIDIDVADDFTTFEDPATDTAYYYKFAYYNSYYSLETTQSDAIAATGFVFHSQKTLVDRVLSLFGDSESEAVTRDEVTDYLNEFYHEAQQELAVATKRLSIQPYTFTVEKDTDTYALPGDFLIEKAIKGSRNNGSTFPYNVTMQNIDHLGTVAQTNVIYSYSIVGSDIVLDPVPNNSTDKIKIYYIPTPETLIYQSDTLSSPFAQRSSMFVRYGLANCYLKDKKFDEYKDLRDVARGQLRDFISYIKRLGNVHPQFSEVVDTDLLY